MEEEGVRMNVGHALRRRRHHRLAVAAAVAVAIAVAATASFAASTKIPSTIPRTVAEEQASFSMTTSKAFCGKKPITLGILDALGVNSWSKTTMAVTRMEAAKCPNVKQLVAIGQGSLQKAISDINSMVAQGVNAMVVVPDFGQPELPAIKAAYSAGVKIVPWSTYPGGTPGKDYVAYVDRPAVPLGEVLATWLVKALHGKGNVVILTGLPGPFTQGETQGAINVFKKYPGIKVLTGMSKTSSIATNWDPATALKQMSALIGKYPKIDGIVDDFGTTAVADVRALLNAKRPLVPIATTESSQLSCLYNKLKPKNPGLELATVSATNELGRIAVRKAISAAQGIPNNEPGLIPQPIFEDSLGKRKPICPSANYPADFYFASQLTPAQLEKYGQTH